ncbi:MAG: hypothetical protein ABI478_04385 [Propionivibrio sp.]
MRQKLPFLFIALEHVRVNCLETQTVMARRRGDRAALIAAKPVPSKPGIDLAIQLANIVFKEGLTMQRLHHSPLLPGDPQSLMAIAATFGFTAVSSIFTRGGKA